MDNMHARMRVPERAPQTVESSYIPDSLPQDPPKAAPTENRKKHEWHWPNKLLLFAIAAIAAAGLLFGAGKVLLGGVGADGIDHTKYQAVFLVSSSMPSNVYFGKLERLSDGYYKLSDVYYLRTTSDKEKQQDGNVTVTKMTTELHAPEDALILPREQVLYYQNMTDASKVVQAIKQDNPKN